MFIVTITDESFDANRAIPTRIKDYSQRLFSIFW